jgi:hypothetical protein
VKVANIIVLVVIGIIIGGLLYPVVFPLPELPEPILIPGDTVIVYRDTTVYDTIKQVVPVDVIVTPERSIISVDRRIELFDGAVEFGLFSRDVELDGISIVNARLHLQIKEVTITDTLRLPYAVYVEKPQPFYNTFLSGIIASAIFFLTTLFLL